MGQRQAFYFSDGPYLQALQGLHAALSEPEAFIKLMGNPRTGKSTLCDKLTQFLRRKGHRVIYFGSAIESPDMLRSILARELDLPGSSNFARLLEDALADTGDKPLTLIFDDAHLLTDITLIEIYRLAEVQLNQKRLLNIVLCGETSLERRLLTNQEFKSLLLHVSHKFVLEPMDPDTLSQFFYGYAEKAGLPGLQLEATAMNYFFKSCKGYPGPATTMSRVIVDSRLGQAEMTSVSKPELVQLFKNAANNELLPVSGLRDNNQWRGLMPIAVVLVVASVGFLYQQLVNIDAGAGAGETVELAAAMEAAESPFQSETEADTEARAFVEPDSVTALQTRQLRDQQLQDQQLQVQTQQAAPQPLFSLSEANEEVATIPEAVSDSNLALVTAAEVGITQEDFTQPQYMDLLAIAAALESPVSEATVQVAQTAPAPLLSVSEVSLNAVPLAAIDNTRSNTIPPAVINEAQTLVVDANPPVIESEQSEVAKPGAIEEPVAVAVAEVQEQIPETVIEVAQQETDPVPDPVVDPIASEVAVTEIESERVDIAQLEAATQQWVDAWQSQSLDDYFSHYHSGFVPRYQDTVPAWRSNRQRVIGNANWIRLVMSEFQMIADEAGVIEVHFWLAYESPNYSDNTQKKLLLAIEDGQWRILEEINLQVRT